MGWFWGNFAGGELRCSSAVLPRVALRSPHTPGRREWAAAAGLPQSPEGCRAGATFGRGLLGAQPHRSADAAINCALVSLLLPRSRVGGRNQRLSLQHHVGKSSPLPLLAPQPFPTPLKHLIPSVGMGCPQALPEHPSRAGWILPWSWRGGTEPSPGLEVSVGIRGALLSPAAGGTVLQRVQDPATPSVTPPAHSPLSLRLWLGSWESWLLSMPWCPHLYPAEGQRRRLRFKVISVVEAL